MPDSPLDAERLAALLEGRLSESERARVLEELATQEQWRGVFADVVAVLPEVRPEAEPEAEPEAVRAPEPARATAGTRPSRVWRAGGWTWTATALAASLGVVFVGRVWLSDREPLPGASGFLPAAAATVALEPDTLASLRANRWSASRAGQLEFDEATVAVRLGALAVDVVLATAATSAVGAQRERDEVQLLLAGVTGSGAARRLLQGAADSAATMTALQAVRDLVDADAFDAGATLALLRVDPSSAAGADSVAARVRRVSARAAWSPEKRGLVSAGVAPLVSARSAADADELRLAAAALLRAMASPL